MVNYLAHHGIKGQKWGVRRYQNADGSYTSAGEARLAREQAANAAKKKDNRLPDSAVSDPNKWVNRDMEGGRKVATSSAQLSRDLQKLNSTNKGKQQNKPMDLSNKTDQELRNEINRKMLENQYNQLFSEPSKVNAGRERANDYLETYGNVMAVAASTLSVALAIRELRGK